MTQDRMIRSFITDWFARFDRLDPIEAFLPDLHPEVDWDMPDADQGLNGHDRVRAWYSGVLSSFVAPTEHHISDIEIGDGTISFTVLMRARTHDARLIEAHVHEDWRFVLRPDGRPLITHYSAKPLEKAKI